MQKSNNKSINNDVLTWKEDFENNCSMPKQFKIYTYIHMQYLTSC